MISIILFSILTMFSATIDTSSDTDVHYLQTFGNGRVDTSSDTNLAVFFDVLILDENATITTSSTTNSAVFFDPLILENSTNPNIGNSEPIIEKILCFVYDFTVEPMRIMRC